MSHTYSLKDVAEHSSKECTWFIIKDKVYDVTKFLDEVWYCYASISAATNDEWSVCIFRMPVIAGALVG